MNLVEEEIESSVSKMQTVIELGRIIRDRKTIPVKVGHTSSVFKC